MNQLDLLPLVSSYQLRYIVRADRADTDMIYTVQGFQGFRDDARRLPKWRRPENGATPQHTPRRLYLCDADGQPLLNLHPLLIAYHYPNSRRLFFLESNRENEEIWYGHCGSGDQFPLPSQYRSLRESLFAVLEDASEQIDPVASLHQAEAEIEEAESGIPDSDEVMLSVYMARLSPNGRAALSIALGEALRIGHFWLGVEFLLMGLSKQSGQPFSELLHHLNESRGHFRGVVRGLVGVKAKEWRDLDVRELGDSALDKLVPVNPATLADEYDNTEEMVPVVTPRMLQVLRKAAELADDGEIDHDHLLLATLQPQHHVNPAVNLLFSLAMEAGMSPTELHEWLARQAHIELDDSDRAWEPTPGTGPWRDDRTRPRLEQKSVLGQYGRDLTALALQGGLHPAVGEQAHKAMVQMGLILQQTQANNPILLGDPGVGKTAIVEGFAYRLATDSKVVEQLAGKRIVEMSANALLAGTKYRGDLENRLQQLIKEVGTAGNETIVFIDEIHTILGGKSESGLGAIADALKPALSRGELPVIGASTVTEYRRYIESDAALARRFTPVWLEEPSMEEAVEIAWTVATDYLEPQHRVTYPRKAVEEAVRLSVRYIHDEFLPGKAIKLLDQAGPRTIMGAGSLSGLPDEPKLGGGSQVTTESIREIVSERTGIPLTSLSQNESEKLMLLEEALRTRVKGQDEAIAHVTQVIKQARLGLADPRRPLGVFLFAGPTGTGKTELALALGAALFDDERALLRLDMSEYMEKHQISRLIGSPPGYVGYSEEGQLTGWLRRHPYSIVLLDEIEKAHPDVQHLFLQIFDAGRLTDSRGRVADARNAIFILTTNLGASEAIGFSDTSQTYNEKLQEAIDRHFTLEFLNRVDRTAYFTPLSMPTLLAIFDNLFSDVASRFAAQQIQVEVDDGFKQYLVQRYTDKKRGARFLQRGIDDEIIAPLTERMLAGKVQPGTRVIVAADGELDIKKAPGAPAPPLEEVIQLARQRPLTPADANAAMEERNRKNMEALLEELNSELQGQGITVTVERKARELLCSPYFAEARNGDSTAVAWKSMVVIPLMEQIEDGKFTSGETVEVYRDFGRIYFRQNQEGTEK